ncbi:MAG: hypothetical protein EZS28_031122 [Streblomastix strix]|uniref:Uncharacterized protein n=1 Tax=Streblomastix strix TaxID=222440 RepID=A0A5J4UTP8_9EUKA|nr:MAG: hypothetical protein EZS28_031122 [Streblomastix strix]
MTNNVFLLRYKHFINVYVWTNNALRYVNLIVWRKIGCRMLKIIDKQLNLLHLFNQRGQIDLKMNAFQHTANFFILYYSYRTTISITSLNVDVHHLFINQESIAKFDCVEYSEII